MIYLNTLLAESKLKLNLPSDIKKIYKLFKKNGKQLYVVGGAVRDAILGKSPKDFDLATDAKPDEVLKIAKQGGFKTVEVGKSFGVVIVNGHEIATFRKDIGKGRRPDSVDFTDIQGDVKRRDLTINALFYDMGRKEIVDLVGGIKDLQKKQVRTVGNAKQRFDEDPLRKLRAVRFTASVGGKMHADTYNALKQDSNLGGISRERVRDEFIKGIKKAKIPNKYLKLIDKLGMLQQILPNMKLNKKFINSNDHIIQLSYLLIKNKATKVLPYLNIHKYTNQESKNVFFLISLLSFNPKNIFIVKKNQTLTSLNNGQLINWGKLIGKSKLMSKIISFNLSVKGGDLAKQGFKGSQIQDKIKDVEYKKFMGEN
tara:strand:+ start:142 stop:1251 length:1110 start_codon:yes stop_codon:yes gene_type:complete